MGVKIRVETRPGIYELKVIDPKRRLVEITGSASGLRNGIIGEFVGSVVDIENNVFISDWIGVGLRARIFIEGKRHRFAPALSVRVEGADWHYDVF